MAELLVFLLVFGSFAIFLWLLVPSPEQRRRAGAGQAGGKRDLGADRSTEIGAGTGLMGGDLEDAVVTRYALSRTPKDPDSSPARDLGTALGMKNGLG